MKNKLFFTVVILLTIISLFLKKEPIRKKETYSYLLSKKEFYKKIKNHPSWMNDQIEKDFKFLKENKVSLNALEETLKKAQTDFREGKDAFVRYRIVDNKLYQFLDYDQKLSKKEEVFEKALKTILSFIKVEDIDFIFSTIDGIPDPKNNNITTSYFENRRDFYLIKDKNLQAPILTRAKSSNVKEAILIPDYWLLSELWKKTQMEILDLDSKISWDEKNEIIFWRGASSKASRFTLCEISLNNNLVDAGFCDYFITDKDKELKLWNKTDIYSKLLKNHSTIEEQLKYKYLPVLDGVMCTYPGYQWRLLSNSVTFKQGSDEEQWFYSALKPYEHYIPVKNDLSDLVDKINWAKENDDQCRKIAKNSTEFVLNNLMYEDIYVYFYKVLKEYAKHQTFSKEELKNDLKKDKRWMNISDRRKTNKKIQKEDKN
ncbi:MAG: hypothetical protein A3F40_04550 [Chlamydiae bacterium RIFCSPHIGHO2_12_FULL_27_8]|nr:MAG: hypothetical protein A3F40_04550 [Chlamydiae bacterium RIFCSPHIGHO2_12_FULL_27_8]